MVTFDENDQVKRITNLRESEEEDVVALMAEQQYNMQHVNLISQSIDNDAIRLLSEEQARTFDVGPYKLVDKKYIWQFVPRLLRVLSMQKRLLKAMAMKWLW